MQNIIRIIQKQETNRGPAVQEQIYNNILNYQFFLYLYSEFIIK